MIINHINRQLHKRVDFLELRCITGSF